MSQRELNDSLCMYLCLLSWAVIPALPSAPSSPHPPDCLSSLSRNQMPSFRPVTVRCLFGLKIKGRTERQLICIVCTCIHCYLWAKRQIQKSLRSDCEYRMRNLIPKLLSDSLKLWQNIFPCPFFQGAKNGWITWFAWWCAVCCLIVINTRVSSIKLEPWDQNQIKSLCILVCNILVMWSMKSF